MEAVRGKLKEDGTPSHLRDNPLKDLRLEKTSGLKNLSSEEGVNNYGQVSKKRAIYRGEASEAG